MIATDVRLGRGVTIHHPEQVNLYGCAVGDNCKIASFVEIQRGVVLGNNVKVEAFAFLPTGVIVEDGAFIGPHVCFTNDRYPAAIGPDGALLQSSDWEVVPTLVKRGACIGANATIVCGVTIGEDALVAAGSVVTRDVPPGVLVRGAPARVAGPRPVPAPADATRSSAPVLAANGRSDHREAALDPGILDIIATESRATLVPDLVAGALQPVGEAALIPTRAES